MTTCATPVLRTPSGLAYRVQGAPDGTPVLSLHGTPGSRFSGTPAADALHALGVRVITYDRRGYGDTPADEDRPVRGLAADVVEVLADAGVTGPAGVVAASGGSATAIAAAAQRPDLVGALTLVWPLAPLVDEPGSPGMGPMTWAREMEEQQQAMHRLALADPVFLRDQLELAMGAEAGAAGIVTDMVQLQEPWDVDPAQVRCPVDLWWGSDSAVSPRGHAEWFAARLAGAEVHRHEVDEPHWHVRRLVEIYEVLGHRLGARPRSPEEVAAAKAAQPASGCGNAGSPGGCACGAAGCGPAS